MLRCPLENVVLKAKLLEMGSPNTVLGLSMNPPNLSDIQNTITILKEAGALYKYASDIYTIEDGDISFIGRVMAVMPLDVRLTRLIILGWLFGALEESIIIGKYEVTFILIFSNDNSARLCVSCWFECSVYF